MDTPKEEFYDEMYRKDFYKAEIALKKLRGKSKKRAEKYFLEIKKVG